MKTVVCYTICNIKQYHIIEHIRVGVTKKDTHTHGIVTTLTDWL